MLVAAKKIFAELDTNNDGFVEPLELKPVLAHCTIFQFGDAAGDEDLMLRRVMDQLDKDGDGLLSLQEFCEGYSLMMFTTAGEGKNRTLF